MEERDLGQRILHLLSSRSKKQDSSTKLANALRIPKKALNTELYKLEKSGRVARVQESPPLWCLASEVVSVSLSGGDDGSRRQTRSRGAHNNKVDEALVEKVLQQLQERRKPSKALDIAKAVGLSKAADVNPSLYHLEKKQIACKHEGKPPLWGLADRHLDSSGALGGESPESMAAGDTAKNVLCKEEGRETQPGLGGNIPIFQETELFQAGATNYELGEASDLETDGETTMDTEGISLEKPLDVALGISDRKYLCSEDSSMDEEALVETGPEADTKPKSFRAMFNLDAAMSNVESDGDMEEDIRETFMENYRKQNEGNDSNSSENIVKMEPIEDRTSLPDTNMPAETSDTISAGAGPDTAEVKDCLTVLMQLAAFPAMTNFVLKKKTLLSDEQLNSVMEKCLSLNYVSGSTKLWKITEAGQNIVNSHSGPADKPSEEHIPAQMKTKSIVKTTGGPPPTPMAILKSQGGLPNAAETGQAVGGALPSSSLMTPGQSMTVPVSSGRMEGQGHMAAGPRPLMSLQLGPAPLLKTSSATSSFTSTGSSSQTSQGFRLLNTTSSSSLLSNQSSSSNETNQMSNSLWSGFQSENKESSNDVPQLSFQNSNTIMQPSNFKQRELPGFKTKFSEQAPPKPDITPEYMNYPNQKTSHEVLRSLHKPSGSSGNTDLGRTAMSKGLPPTPMELLTKHLKKTEISPGNKPEPPKTIYQQSTTMSAITSTSTFSRPGPFGQHVGNNSIFNKQFNQPMIMTGTSSNLGLGMGSDFRSLPPSNTNSAMLIAPSSSSNSLALSSESFAALNKNPVSALMEYAQSRKLTARIEVIRRSGSSHRPTFEMAAFVGDRKFPSITCHNKKDGRKEASDMAMRQLIAQGQFQAGSAAPKEPGVSRSLVASENMTHFDKIAALTHRGFTALVSQISESFAGRKVIAGLVMKRSDTDTGVLISLGTGNRCITGEQLSLQGNTINDSHAEIITRRGFIRFLYKQLLEYDPSKSSPLFEKSPSGKFRIKPNITFHLYISTAPCGDGALFSPRDAEAMKAPLDTRVRPPHNPTFSSAVQGLLRTKVEGGEGTIPVEADFTTQTFDGIQRGERLRTMSCTDKICRWNVVGMQGALLSQFLDPVYLDSLCLGLLFDQGHLSRAVCCRVAYGPTDVDELLPNGYRLNHPWLGRVTVCDPPREIQKTKALSVNWSFGDSGPEVTDGTKGLCYTSIEKGFFSRCSKKNLFSSYKALCQKFGRHDLLQVTNYNEAKKRAAEFNVAKKAMLEKFKENKLGKWVSKPVEEEMFAFEAT